MPDMSFDQNSVSAILGAIRTMPKESLREAVSQAASIGVISEKQKQRATADLDKLQSRLSQLSEQEIGAISAYLGKEKVEELISKLRENGTV